MESPNNEDWLYMVHKYFLLLRKLSHFLEGALWSTKVLYFDEVQLFFLWSVGLLVSSLRLYLIQGQEDIHLCFLISVLALTFRSMMHFKLIFVCGIRKESSFILFPVDIQLFCTIGWKGYWIVLALWSNSIDHKCKSLFLDFPLSSISLYFCSHTLALEWVLPLEKRESSISALYLPLEHFSILWGRAVRVLNGSEKPQKKVKRISCIRDVPTVIEMPSF